ncbi:MAG: cell envelope integrity protein TolA [Croceivirga sp.]
MNRKITLYSLVFLTGTSLFAQKSKTYKETFNTNTETVLEITTSHTDIEFDTWDADKVEIVATVTFEGDDEEEAEAYFQNNPITIIGNSEVIKVRTRKQGSRSFLSTIQDFDLGDLDFQFDVEPLFLDLEIPDLPELAAIPELPLLPPLPPMNFKSFDYSRYQDEGNDYLEEWAESFKEGFDAEYEEKVKEWRELVEERANAWKERNAKELKAREKRMEERAKQMEEQAQERVKVIEQRAKEAQERRMARIKAREEDGDRLFISRDDGGQSIFFLSADGEGKKYKVKKTIKIKMPKSVRLKMNVNHGEVKLAATAKDVEASLRYASLLASTIEGKETSIQASYTPIVVQNWNLGQLKADYSDRINLNQVGELQLDAVSSNVSIDKLLKKIFVTNNLGKLSINEVSSGFSDIDVSVQNGEVVCKLPNTPVSFYLNGTRSTIDYPTDLTMESTKNFDNVIYKGFKGRENSGKQITINSRYSEVLLRQ